MTANLPLLLVAVALLWLPRSWIRRGPSVWRKRRSGRGNSWKAPTQDGQSLTFRRDFSNPRNFFDFFRGAVGTLAIMGGLGVDAAINARVGAPRSANLDVLGLRLAILVIGVLLQTLRYERQRLSLAAPVFYIGGLTAIVGTPTAGLAAFAIAWAFTPIVANAQGFLCLEASVLGLVGVWLNGIGIPSILGFGFCFLPVLLSLLTRRPLIVFSRRPSSSNRD